MTNARQRIEQRRQASGFTLIELMIAVAILAIIAAIAIPTYEGYRTTSRKAAAQANIEPLRLAMEDYWLDNGRYGNNGDNWKLDPRDGTDTLSGSPIAWAPDGDKDMFIYEVSVTNANSATITVTHKNDSNAVATLNLSK